MKQVTIGRMVHYTNLGDKDGKYPPEVQAALVTGVYYESPLPEGCARSENSGEPANKVGDVPNCSYVDLTVFYRTGYFQCKKIPYSETPERGHWNYPPKV